VLSTAVEPKPIALGVEIYKDDAKPMKVINTKVKATKQSMFVTVLALSIASHVL
jgi:hypothetical protein